jgi:hypothetical protein
MQARGLWRPDVADAVWRGCCTFVLHMASSSRSQVGALPPCCVGCLTSAQPSTGVHRHSLAAGGIVTQLVTRPSCAHPGPARHRSLLHFRGLPADDSVTSLVLVAITRPVSGNPAAPDPVSGPSPEPDSCRTIRQTGSVRGRRSRSRVTPKAPLTGSGCREHSYGGFGGGHPHFHPHAPDLQIRRSMEAVRPVRRNPYRPVSVLPLCSE